MALTFNSDRTQECTPKQKKYVRNLLKQYPSLGAPADYQAHTIRSWLDRARAALGAGDGPSSGHPYYRGTDPEYTPDRVLYDVVGDPLGDMLRDEYRAALGGL